MKALDTATPRHLYDHPEAGTIPLIAARVLGLDCCPIPGFDNAKRNTFFHHGHQQITFLLHLS